MDKLCFCSAAFGSWGIVRLGTLVPECHMLFVCPYSCGRHNSIGAIQHGYKDKISYLFIDERDLALGTVEVDLPEAISGILEELVFRPKVILIYFSCVLYMSGFDWDASISLLGMEYPDIQFRACMMNPITGDTKRPPVPVMIQSLCSLWKIEKRHEKTINLLGCYVGLHAECELSEVLRRCGYGRLLHFLDMHTYEDYSHMGSSCLNLVIRPEGLLAAKELASDIPYCFVPVSYDLRQIKIQYEQIFSVLGKDVDLTSYETAAMKVVKETKEIIGSRALAIGSSAVCRPFSLARALIYYGFTVSDVFYDSCPAFEQEAQEELKRMNNIAFHNINDPENVDSIGHMGKAEIAVGYSAGYHTGAKYVADLMIDEGMFGYGGVIRMMKLLQDAVKEPSAVETMIESYGLIV